MYINDEIEIIKNIILKTVKAEKIYLFGSFANGTQNGDSDYDFYVVVPDDGNAPLETTQGIYRAISRIKRRPVDVLVRRSSDFNQRKNLLTIENTVDKQGVMLYEQ